MRFAALPKTLALLEMAHRSAIFLTGLAPLTMAHRSAIFLTGLAPLENRYRRR